MDLEATMESPVGKFKALEEKGTSTGMWLQERGSGDQAICRNLG